MNLAVLQYELNKAFESLKAEVGSTNPLLPEEVEVEIRLTSWHKGKLQDLNLPMSQVTWDYNGHITLDIEL